MNELDTGPLWPNGVCRVPSNGGGSGPGQPAGVGGGAGDDGGAEKGGGGMRDFNRVGPSALRAAADLLEVYMDQGTVDQLREMRGENERLTRRVEELRATVETQLATINRLNRALDEERRQR